MVDNVTLSSCSLSLTQGRSRVVSTAAEQKCIPVHNMYPILKLQVERRRVLIQPFLLYYVNHVVLMLTSIFKQNFL